MCVQILIYYLRLIIIEVIKLEWECKQFEQVVSVVEFLNKNQIDPANCKIVHLPKGVFGKFWMVFYTEPRK